MKREVLHSISLLVTEDCNLACKYCYEVNSTGHKKNIMSIETADRVIQFLQEELKKGNMKLGNISLFGGEPTLNMDVIKYMFEKASNIKDVDIRFGMITNATNMNEKIYNIFKEYNHLITSVQLSIDGPEHVQNLYRVKKSGNGSFSSIQKNLDYWKELFKDKLSIHGVLNKKTLPYLYESYLFFRETWGIEKLWFLPAKDTEFTEDDVQLYKKELNKIYDYVMDKVRATKKLDEIQYYAPLDRSLRSVTDRASKPCGAGNNYCSITANGDIYPCHHFYYIDKDNLTRLGNIFDGYDYQKKLIWDSYESSNLIGCEDCDHNACYRCIAENYETFGSPFSQLKDLHCGFMKVDFYFQNKIRQEVSQMGLLDSQKSTGNGNCDGLIRDCVGKQGDCSVVTRVEDCKFDRGDTNIKSFENVSDKKESCQEKKESCCGNSNKVVSVDIDKKKLDMAINLLIEIYNKL